MAKQRPRPILDELATTAERRELAAGMTHIILDARARRGWQPIPTSGPVADDLVADVRGMAAAIYARRQQQTGG